MVATRSSAWQSWHDPPQKTEVCLSLSAGPGKALEASCASLPSPPLAGKARRVTDAHDWRGFPRTREDIAHPYWLLTNPYSVHSFAGSFVDPSIQALSLSLSLSLSPSPFSISSFLFRTSSAWRLDATHPSVHRHRNLFNAFHRQLSPFPGYF